MLKINMIQNKYLNNYKSSFLVNSISNDLSGVFGNFHKIFLSYCEKQIDMELEKFKFKYSFEVDRDNIINSLLISVSEEITILSTRTLIVELNYFKGNNLLLGSNSVEKYNYFNNKLNDSKYISEIFYKYPVLLYLLDKKITDRLCLIKEILEHLCDDIKDIESKFNLNCYSLSNISISSGDSHNNGKKVAILKLGNQYLVYKPHGLSPEGLFNDIIDYLNKKDVFEFNLKKLECIDRISYGWQEFAVYGEAESSKDSYNFFYCIGAFLSIFYMFSCSDLHHENILACKDTPVIFDLETLINIFNNSSKNNLVSEAINKEISTSVLGTMLLPVNLKSGCFDFDMSGMSGTENTVSSKWFYYKIDNVGTDEISLKKEPCSSPKSNNSLILDNNIVSPKLNFNIIKKGFKTGYIYLDKYKNEILQIINRSMLVVRHVLRPTAIYARFLEASTYPKYLVSFDEMRDLFSKLGSKYSNKSVFKCEIDALMQHDIPYFSSYINSTTLIGNMNYSISNYFAISAYELVNNKLISFSKNDLNKQLYYIAQSLSTIKGSYNENLYNYNFSSNYSYLTNAKLIADQISNLVVFTSQSNEASLLMTLSSNKFKNYTDILDCNLYTGGGIILFLAILGIEINDSKYITLAEKLLSNQLLNSEINSALSAFSGLGSKIYICYNMYKITKKNKYIEKVKELVSTINLEGVKSRDFATGTAGLIIVLLNIFEKELDEEYLKKAKLLGEDLYNYLCINNNKLLTGLAHGISGFTWPLIKLGVITNNEEYINFSMKLISQEDKYYEPSEYNWKDLRSGDVYLSYWCYGAAGISLSRAKIKSCLPNCSDLIDNDLLNGVKNTESYKTKSNSLCHGSFGNIDIIMEIGILNNINSLIKTAENLANIEIENIEKNGIVLGDDTFIIDYSFMQGVSGIAYSLLRLANNKYPSILSLDVI